MTDYIEKIINLYKSLNKINEKYKINEKVVKYTFNKLASNIEFIFKSIKYIIKNKINTNDYFVEHNDLIIEILIDKITPNILLIILSKIKEYFYNCLIYISSISLNGNEEINNNELINTKYHCIINNTLINKKSFEIYLIFYYFNSLLYNKDLYISLDFEFNTKEIALMQINFEEPNINNYKINNFIYILYPPDLKDKTKNIL